MTGRQWHKHRHIQQFYSLENTATTTTTNTISTGTMLSSSNTLTFSQPIMVVPFLQAFQLLFPGLEIQAFQYLYLFNNKARSD